MRTLEYITSSTDLTPSDCHLFQALIKKLGGQKFKDKCELEEVVRR